MLRAQVLAALALILGGFFLTSEAAPGSAPFAQRGDVTAVVDSVTLVVRLSDGTNRRVQLFGIAAPATASCAAAQATADTAALALDKSVWVVAVQGAPPKHRPLQAYVILPEAPDLGLQLVRRGDATVRMNQHRFKQRAAYARAERAAQAASLGLWGCTTGQAEAPAPATTTTPGPGHGKGQGRGQGAAQVQESSDQAGAGPGHGSGGGKK